jgi:hypothetical protein
VKYPRAPVAVVFVHGLFGDTLGTWRDPARGDGKGLIKLLEDAASGGQLHGSVDTYAFGYDSTFLSRASLSPSDAASVLYERLAREGIMNEYPRIVFVAHSVGGLITMRLLLDQPALRSQVPLCFFYSTPFAGSQIATIRERVSANPALKALVPASGDYWVESMLGEWRKTSDKPVLKCAYETAPLASGAKVVEYRQETGVCSEVRPVARDHLQIVRPSSLDDEALQALLEALNQSVFK